MTAKNWLGYVVAWVVTLALGLWFMVRSRSGLLLALAAFYPRESVSHAWQARLFDIVYSVAVGLLWLVFMTVSGGYFRKGAQRRDLLRRFAKVAGPEILLILVADSFLLWLIGGSRSWLVWLTLGGELVIGVGLLLFARFSRASGLDNRELDKAV